MLATHIAGFHFSVAQYPVHGVLDIPGSLGFTQMFHHHADRLNGSHRIYNSFTGIFRCRTVNRLEHRRVSLFGIKIGSGGKTHAALKHGTQIGNNITEQVRGHDDIKRFRIFYHPHGQGIHQRHIGFDVRVILCHLSKNLIPENH